MSKKLIGGVVAAAAAVVAILVGVQVLGGDETPTTASQFQDVPAVLALVKGIPQEGSVIGDPKAPVTITEFADLQCSVCAAASTGVVRELITKYVRPGKAKMNLRLVRIFGPDSERGVFAGEAASLQGKGWTFAEIVLANQGPEDGGWLTDGFAEAAASAGKLDVAQWKKDFAGQEVIQVYTRNTTAFQQSGGNGTPTFVVSGPGGSTRLSNAPLADFDVAIAKARGAN